MPLIPTGLLIACLLFLSVTPPLTRFLGASSWVGWALTLPVFLTIAYVTYRTQTWRERALTDAFDLLLTGPGRVDTPRFDQNRFGGWGSERTVGFWPDTRGNPDWAFRTRPVLLAGLRPDGSVLTVWRYPTRHFREDLGFWYNGPAARHRFTRVLHHGTEDRSDRAERARSMLGLSG